MEIPSSSTSPVKATDQEDLLKRAQNAQFQGKRNFLMKDTASACVALEDACRLLVEIYGPLAKEHAEAHFFYGKALLEQARLDLAVFDAPGAGNDTKSGGEDDEEDDDDDEEEDDEMNEGEEEKEDGEEKETVDKTKEDDKTTEPQENNVEDKEVTEEDINVPSPTSSSTTNANESSSSAAPSVPLDNSDAQPSTSKGVAAPVTGDEDKAAEEELNNLELAWEVFEIAKIDYAKHIEELEKKLFRAKDDEMTAEEKVVQRKSLCDLKRRLAETHSLLGEVGTESEIYPQAIEDFKTALSMYNELESPDSREIAQVHFHIGLAYGLEKNFKESVKSLNDSVDIIRKRIINLTKEIAESTDEAIKGSLVKEVQELTELLPELQEKINDTLEQERDTKRVEEEEKMEQEIIQRNSPVKNPNPPAANDISHLVKKRKKIDLEPVPVSKIPAPVEFSEGVEPPSKKICTNLSFDTNAPSTLTSLPTNGHSVAASENPTKTE